MERDLYNATSERLWEKIEFHRDKFDPKSVNWKKPFPADQIKPNKFFMELVAEVGEEFNYQMSEFQCSWAVNQAFHSDIPAEEMMDSYNEHNGTDLKPRP